LTYKKGKFTLASWYRSQATEKCFAFLGNISCSSALTTHTGGIPVMWSRCGDFSLEVGKVKGRKT
jgi:hypothetical protein